MYFKSRTWRGLLTNIEKWGRLWAVCGRKGSPALGTKGFALASGAGDLGCQTGTPNLHLALGNGERGTLATRKKAELASTISKDLMYCILHCSIQDI